jgi:hypothetical protein
MSKLSPVRRLTAESMLMMRRCRKWVVMMVMMVIISSIISTFETTCHIVMSISQPIAG